MLSRRQINVQRDNLISMCRISVKALLDYACLNTQVDDDCEEFINFCAVFEHLVLHRLRPVQKKAWLPGSPTPRHFWDVLLDAQSRANTLYFQSCVPNIEAIESFKSPQAKLRAFIRVALMEKRLSDYILWILDHQMVLKSHYLEGAVMLSEQASVLGGDLIGLNAIDFNFCLKGNQNEFLGPLEISYSRFLCYKQSAASRNSDKIEMMRLNQPVDDEDLEEFTVPGVSDSVIASGGVLTEGNVNDILRLQQLERDFRSIKEQKDYLEELARLRESQVSKTNAMLETLKAEQMEQEQEWERERRTMDSCILELQADITKLFQQNERLRFQVVSYRQFKDRLTQRDVQLEEMAMDRSNQDKETSSKPVNSSTSSSAASSSSKHKREGSQLSSDLRSLQSTGSDSIRLREDSHSMVPLTGSLAGDEDTGRRQRSPLETGSEGKSSVSREGTPIDIGRTRSVSDQQHRDLPQQVASSQPDADTIMMESFVVTENKSEIERAVKHALAAHNGAGEIISVQVDVAKDGGDVGISALVDDASRENDEDEAQDDDDGDDDNDDSNSVVVKDGGDDEYDDIESGPSRVGADSTVEGDDVKEGSEEPDAGVMETSESTAQHEPSEPSKSDGVEAEEEKDSENVTGKTTNVMSQSDGLAISSEPEDLGHISEAEELVEASEPEDLILTSEPEDLVMTSEPEEIVLTSEPELVDNGNTSSDGSDVAWDMVPDSEQAGDGEQS